MKLKKGCYYKCINTGSVVKLICLSTKNTVRVEVCGNVIFTNVIIKLEYFNSTYKLLSSLEQELF